MHAHPVGHLYRGPVVRHGADPLFGLGRTGQWLVLRRSGGQQSCPAIGYLDLRASYKWNENLQFYAAVDNTLNTPPPNIASYSLSNNGLSTVNPSIYDVLGRMYHAGFRFNY